MQNQNINLPKVSRVLGITFFILAFSIIGYVTISSYLYCNSIHNAGMCGSEAMLINLPMVHVYDLYHFLLPGIEVPELIDLLILIVSSSIFWAFIGVCIGLFVSLCGLIIKQIKYGSHAVKFGYLILVIILCFILFRFFAIHFLI